MGKYNQIISLLDRMDAEYDVIEHAPVVTSKQAEAVTGHHASMGAKSIVFKLNDTFLLCVVRGNNMADFTKLRRISGSRKARLATPDEVLSVMGVRIGACYPFGAIAGIDMVVDETLAENEKVTFSPGVHDKHIVMPWQEYERVTSPKLVDIRRVS